LSSIDCYMRFECESLTRFGFPFMRPATAFLLRVGCVSARAECKSRCYTNSSFMSWYPYWALWWS
jgi:hypothetical protein